MTQLSDIPHDTNFAHITITRIGDRRNTDYRVSVSEAKPETAAAPVYDPEAAIMVSDFLRRKYGHKHEDQE